ncbi:MAG: hypothetical protein V1652_03190 [bacterium]
MISKLVFAIVSYGLSVFILPLLLFLWLRRWVLLKQHDKWIESIDWIILELKLPVDNIRTPKAMEQVFASLYGMFSFGISFKDRWMKGKLESWASFELVGFSSSMHFFIRVPKQFQKLLESSIYSHYPNAELQITEDYVHRFGQEIPNTEYDIFGTDFVLLKDGVYPLKTYRDFEAIEEEKRLDPLATVAEIMADLKDDEMIWLQFLIRPTGTKWKEKANDIIQDISGRPKPPKKKSNMEGAREFAKNLATAAVKHPEWSESETKQVGSPPRPLMPGEQDLLFKIDSKIGQIGFESILRFMYLDKKNSFTEPNVLAMMGVMRQFNGVNEFLPNKKTLTTPKATGLFFRKSRILGRKKKLFDAYCKRAMPVEPRRFGLLRLKTSILSVEELATLYHPPISSVTARTLQYVGSKKGGPPSDIPIVK